MKLTKFLSAAVLFCVASGCAAQSAKPAQPKKIAVSGQPLQTLTLREAFGVSHPNQIIDFDVDPKVKLDPANTVLVGPDGTEATYQLLEGGKKVAIETDLAANETKTYRLVSGKPSASDGGVKVTKTANYHEITNGLTGIRIPVATTDLKSTPAPVQGVLLRDGTWSGTGPNALSFAAKKMDVKFLEQGPLKTVVEVSYQFDRPELNYGKVLVEAGEGSYKSTIVVQSGQPSILFEEDSDTDVQYSLDLTEGIEPTQARYRGHHAKSKRAGYEESGEQYRQWHSRPGMDAFFDLPFEVAHESSYAMHLDQWHSIRRMAVWDPWVYDSGWYWQFYNKDAPATANMAGIFAGRASRAIGAGASGVGIFTKPMENGERRAGLTMAIWRRSPDARVFPRVRFQWGLFTGTKSDMKPPSEIQPIARQMNLHGGINLNKVHRIAVEYPNLPQGYGGLYMDRAALQKKIARVREDEEYFRYLYNAESGSRELIDMWRDTTGEKRVLAAKGITDFSQSLLDKLVNGDGIYTMGIHYWHGGLEMGRKALWIDQVLADPQATPEQRAEVKAAAALFGAILWDNDFVPMFNGHGLNMGTANMPVQQRGYMDFYALFLATHPMMKGRTEEVEANTLANLRGIINEHGAAMGSAHYISASAEPTVNTLLQLKMLGKNHFKTEPRLRKFAEFYMGFLTPKEVRFGGKRKIPAIGDGSTETTVLPGLLATGFADADPQLSARLMGAWQTLGRPESNFFGTTLIKIDDTAKVVDPALKSANFPGWYSALRSKWGEPNESALWFVNGDFYSDHRHADHGSFVLYALGAPISVDWGSIYYPQVAGGFMHSMVVPEGAIGHAWEADNPPLTAGPYGVWTQSTQDGFQAGEKHSFSKAQFTSQDELVWTRRMDMAELKSGDPVIAIRDTFSGKGADTFKVVSLNLMAEGAVSTPAGEVTPTLRLWDDAKGVKELPSAGKVFELKPGQNRLGFNGQWGVDFDVYTFADGAQQAHIGNWGHTWHPSGELGEFAAAHNRPFEERQHILRVRGDGPFTTLMVPFKKGSARPNVQVQQAGGVLSVTVDGEKVTLQP